MPYGLRIHYAAAWSHILTACIRRRKTTPVDGTSMNEECEAVKTTL